MQPNTKLPNTQKLAIGILFAFLCVFLFIILQKASDNREVKVYKDPNNGEEVITDSGKVPEFSDKQTQLVITGRAELLEQGLSSTAIDFLPELFLQYNKDVTFASIVKKSVRQYRDNPNSGFSYSFEVQIDKKDYFLVVIDSTDSTTGKISLFTKDKKTLLKSVDYGLNIKPSNDPDAEGSGEE